MGGQSVRSGINDPHANHNMLTDISNGDHIRMDIELVELMLIRSTPPQHQKFVANDTKT
jgi:hypothetical protein